MGKLKSYSAKTNQGPYLQVNEDELDVDLVNNLYVVYDGLGGSGIGDVAVKAAKDGVRQFYGKVGGDADATMPFYFSHKYLIEGNALINAFHFAHEDLKARNGQQDLSRRGAVSAVGMCLADNVATLVGTGNCMALLYRRGHLEMALGPDNGKMLAHDNFTPQYHSYPMSGMGLFDDLHIQVRELRLLKDDLVLLVTDGAYARVREEEIRSIIERKGMGLKDRAQELFALANSRGNMDNQTALLLQF